MLKKVVECFKVDLVHCFKKQIQQKKTHGGID